MSRSASSRSSLRRDSRSSSSTRTSPALTWRPSDTASFLMTPADFGLDGDLLLGVGLAGRFEGHDQIALGRRDGLDLDRAPPRSFDRERRADRASVSAAPFRAVSRVGPPGFERPFFRMKKYPPPPRPGRAERCLRLSWNDHRHLDKILAWDYVDRDSKFARGTNDAGGGGRHPAENADAFPDYKTVRLSPIASMSVFHTRLAGRQVKTGEPASSRAGRASII